MAATIAARTSQILIEETGVADTVDPLAGSYYVENLTNEIEKRVWEYLNRVEKMGEGMKFGPKMLSGVIAGIESGFFENEIALTNYRKWKDIESGRRVIVGVNKYQVEEEIPIELMKVDMEVQRVKIERLKGFKQSRNQKEAGKVLKEVEKVAASGENIMPTLIEAVKAKATLGEIINVMKKVFGEYKGVSCFV
jgi:methylmalonyl-CoA mutase N-terminal domain/subunit